MSNRSRPRSRCTGWVAATLIAFLILSAAKVGSACAQGSVDSIEQLRIAVRAHPDSAGLLLRLGRALARDADEVESRFQERVEAQGYLDRAVRLLPGEPRPWLEYGLLLRKQHKNVDALRALKHAETSADELTHNLSAEERADLHEQMALIYERWWEDWATLGILPEAFLAGMKSCSRMAGKEGTIDDVLIELNYRCPHLFNEAMAYWKPIDDLKLDDRAAMVHHLTVAIEADPNRMLVRLRLLRWLADWGRWDEYVTRALDLTERRPDDPESWLFLGLGYHEIGRGMAADSAYRRALSAATPELRRALLDVTPLLPRADSATVAVLPDSERQAVNRTYWAARDPLYLTPDNERLSEHFARVAYSDLAFSTPESGLPGRWSDKGRLWITLGRPDQIRSIAAVAGGRIEFWDYGPDTPDFVFHRQLTYRYATAEPYRDDSARPIKLETYRSVHPRMVGPMPFQAARFRAAGGLTEVDIYASVAPESLALKSSDTVRTGLFVFALDPWDSVSAVRRSIGAVDAGSHFHFVAQLRPGHFTFSLEALANDRATKSRDTITSLPSSTGLSLSDVLLADRITPLNPRPSSRSQIAVEGSPTRVFRADGQLGVLWEIYGLVPDSDGVARYHVQVEVRDTRGALARGLRVLMLQGGGTSTALQWTATRRLVKGEAAPEYVVLRLASMEPGEYRVTVTVVDPKTAARAMTTRSLTVMR